MLCLCLHLASYSLINCSAQATYKETGDFTKEGTKFLACSKESKNNYENASDYSSVKKQPKNDDGPLSTQLEKTKRSFIIIEEGIRCVSQSPEKKKESQQSFDEGLTINTSSSSGGIMHKFPKKGPTCEKDHESDDNETVKRNSKYRSKTNKKHLKEGLRKNILTPYTKQHSTTSSRSIRESSKSLEHLAELVSTTNYYDSESKSTIKAHDKQDLRHHNIYQEASTASCSTQTSEPSIFFKKDIIDTSLGDLNVLEKYSSEIQKKVINNKLRKVIELHYSIGTSYYMLKRSKLSSSKCSLRLNKLYSKLVEQNTKKNYYNFMISLETAKRNSWMYSLPFKHLEEADISKFTAFQGNRCANLTCNQTNNNVILVLVKVYEYEDLLKIEFLDIKDYVEAIKIKCFDYNILSRDLVPKKSIYKIVSFLPEFFHFLVTKIVFIETIANPSNELKYALKAELLNIYKLLGSLGCCFSRQQAQKGCPCHKLVSEFRMHVLTYLNAHHPKKACLMIYHLCNMLNDPDNLTLPTGIQYLYLNLCFNFNFINFDLTLRDFYLSIDFSACKNKIKASIIDFLGTKFLKSKCNILDVLYFVIYTHENHMEFIFGHYNITRLFFPTVNYILFVDVSRVNENAIVLYSLKNAELGLLLQKETLHLCKTN